MILSSLSFFYVSIPILLNVAFFTLLERKILGLSQLRKGPNKVSLGGQAQPFADAIKLFMKEYMFPMNSMLFFFFMSPMCSIFLVLMSWWLMPFSNGHSSFTYSSSLFLIFLALNIYPLFLAGLSSSNKYALIGATRGIAQSVSYEISLALILLSFLILSHDLMLENLVVMSSVWSLNIFYFPLFIFWVVCCVAETNRSPFDFAEGESELVSGFNIEYGSSGFALIFMAEYGMILFLSLLSSMMLFGQNIFLIISGLLFWSGFWVWLRCTYPRYRYDKLMNLAWKSILPLTLLFGCYVIGMSA